MFMTHQYKITSGIKFDGNLKDNSDSTLASKNGKMLPDLRMSSADRKEQQNDHPNRPVGAVNMWSGECNYIHKGKKWVCIKVTTVRQQSGSTLYLGSGAPPQPLCNFHTF